MKITSNELQNIASQARIYLKENELENMQTNINDILEYISILDKYEVTNQFDEQMTVGENRFREDISSASITLEEALSNAQRKNENFFKVPKVLENE